VVTAVLVLCLAAVVITVPQWLLIRKRFARPAAWWFLAGPLGWLVGVGLLALAAVLNAFDPAIFPSPRVFGVIVPPLVVFSFCRTIGGVRICCDHSLCVGLDGHWPSASCPEDVYSICILKKKASNTDVGVVGPSERPLAVRKSQQRA
jgi:hypothetical protein